MALLVPFRRFCQLIGEHEAEILSDAELLGRFAAAGDEAAFATLVRRHGPLVLRVCRHVLQQEQDAEDALQATFFVLARKAASVRKGRSLASWLHGVAYRTASNARRIAMRRRRHEQGSPPRTVEPTTSVAALRELQVIVDKEVQCLPEQYKAPLVLCCMEGKGRAEAAAVLGWKEGTVSSRLARARELLRQRLVRRGVTVSAALGAYALTHDPATVSAALAAEIVRAVRGFMAGHATGLVSPSAATLATGVLKGMGAARIHRLLALACGLTLLAAAGAVAVSTCHDQETPPVTPANPSPKDPVAEKPAPVDRFGDPLPAGAIARLGTTRFRQGERVSGVAFSPDGRTIASAGWDKTVLLWEAATGKDLGVLGPLERPAAVSVAFAPDGAVVATGAWFGPVILWDPATGKRLRELPGSPGGFSAVAFARDGKTVAVGGSCADSVRVYETATGRELLHLTKDKAPFASSNDSDTSLAFSPDGKVLAAAHGPVVRLWEMDGGKLLRQLEGHKDRVTTLASPPTASSLPPRAGTARWSSGRRTAARKCGGSRRPS